MSNIEVFNKIFLQVSKKIIDEHLKKVEEKRVNYKNRYYTSIRSKNIIDSLNNNINSISVYLINNLNIKDEDSVVKIINEQINSEYFKYSISVFNRPIDSVRKITVDDIKDKYISHLYYYLTGNSFREKIMALSTEISFKQWTKRRWKIVLTGYIITILILLLTYYVFIGK